MAEIVFGGSVHPVGSTTKVNLVEVELQNLVLGPTALHLDGPPQFLQLAGEGLLRSVAVQGSRNLLGEGASSSQGLAGDNAHHSPENGLEAESVVLVEDPVLTGDEGVQHVLGKLDEADDFPVFVGGELGYQLSIYIQKTGREGCGEFREIFGVDGVGGLCQQKAQQRAKQ